MALIANLVARLAVDHSAFDRGMTNSRKSLRGLAQEGVLSNKALVAMGKNLLGMAGAAGAIYAIKQALTASFKEAANFEMGLAKVSTQLERADMGMLPQFRQEIQRMAIAYGEATSSLSQGAMDILGSAIAPSKAMKVLEASTIAAKGGFTQTSTVVRAVVGVLNAYGMEADRAANVTDVMHKIVQNGVISFEELAHGFGMVTSLSAVLGVDLEAVGAAISTITRAGVPADVALTSLRAILNAFMNPTPAAIKAAAELGFSLDATSIRGTGLITVMEKLRGANAAQLEALMPNVRGLVGLTAMFKSAEGAGRDLWAMQNAHGASMDKLAKVQDTAAFATDRAAEAWKRLKVAMGDVILGDVAAKMNEFADSVQNGESWLQRMVKTAQRANHPIQTMQDQARTTGSSFWGGPGGEATAAWRATQMAYGRLSEGDQASLARAFNSRDILLPSGMGDTSRKALGIGEAPELRPDFWSPAHHYQFDATKMPVAMDYDKTDAERSMTAARTDIDYAMRLSRAYLRAPFVQNRVRGGIDAQMAQQRKADALRTRISGAIGNVPGRLGGFLDSAVGSVKSWAAAEPTEMQKYLADLREETKMLGMSEEAQRLYAATQKATDIARKDFAEGLRTTPILLDEETRAIRDLIAEQERLAKAQAEQEFAGKVSEKIKDIQFETKLLGMTNEQRERAILFRQLENEAAQANVELTAAQREELQATLDLYERQQKIAEMGQILGTGTVDSLRAMQDALITGGDAWEALGNVALNVLQNIQNALVWKPLEDMATSWGTQFLNNIIGGGAGMLAGGGSNLGGSADAGSYATVGSSGYTTSSGMSTVTGEVLHGGGFAGSGYSRMVSASIFSAAPRFHLGADEVPSILQRGERVTSTAGVAAERQAFGQMVALLRQIARKDQRITLNDRRQRTDEYLASRAGEKKVMWHVARNQT